MWKDIPGYEGYYQANTLGDIRSLDRIVLRNGKEVRLKGGIVKQSIRGGASNNRLAVTLNKDGKTKRHSVHTLIAKTFIGVVPGLEVCHINSICTDNRLCNLKLDTHEENLIDEYRNGLTNSRGKLNYKEAYQIRELYKNKLYTQYELANIYNIDQGAVNKIVNYKSFKFIDDNGNIKPSKTAVTYNDTNEKAV